ncbi:MAG: translocation/assembly module TamB domain-containing protein, partial [Bacteroidaceae bacterium]|nr:translocation/assembly module TamB domain-containing protein [Bacteroidaceae bacterium]
MKKTVRAILFIILLPIVLVALLAVAVYCPPVQNWLVGKAAAYASEATGMQISIDNVRLAFPLDLRLGGVKALRPDTTASGEVVQDTIADIHSLYVDVQLLPLFRGQVMVDALEFGYMKICTSDFIEAARIKGSLRMLKAESHGIDLRNETLRLDLAQIDGADVDILLNDSVPEDTTKTEVFWKIQADMARISNSNVRVRSKDMDVAVKVGELQGETGLFDLHKNEYRLAHALLNEADVRYNDIVDITDAAAVVDSIYVCAPDISANIAHLALKEKRGIEVCDLYGRVRMDSTSLHLNDLRLETKHSRLTLGMNMEMNAFADTNPGKLQLAFDGTIGGRDIACFSEYLPKGMADKLKGCQIELGGAMRGNMLAADISRLSVGIPGKMQLKANGSVSNITDINRLRTNLNAELHCPNTDFLTQFIDPKLLAGTGIRMPKGMPLTASVKVSGGMKDMAFENLRLSIPGSMDMTMKGKVSLAAFSLNSSDINLAIDAPNIDALLSCIDPQLLAGAGVTLPKGIGLKGTAGLKGGYIVFDLTASEGGGYVVLKGRLNPDTKHYDVNAETHRFAVNHFMPSLGIGTVDATASAAGKGYDPFNVQTQIAAKAKVGALQYGSYHLTDVQLDALIANGRTKASLDSRNTYLNGEIVLNALNSDRILKGTMSGDIGRINLYNLGVTKVPLSLGMCSHLDFNCDFGENVYLSGNISDITIADTVRTFHPDDITLDIFSSADTTHAVVDCGDFYASLNAHGSYKHLIKKGTALADIVMDDLSKHEINLPNLWNELPLVSFRLKTGAENPLSRFLKFHGIKFDVADIDLQSTPVHGVNGDISLYGVVADSIQLDTIRMKIDSDEDNCVFSGQVRNNKNNPQFVFNALLDGKIMEHGLEAYVTVKDRHDRVGLRIGADAEVEDNRLNMHILDDKGIVIGYEDFTVNSDNHVSFAKRNRVSADLRLRSVTGKGIGIYSNDDSPDVLQDLTVAIANIDLGDLLSTLPYAPKIKGKLNGDYHFVQNEENYSVSSSTAVQALKYEGMDIGNVSTEFVYMPDADGGHHVDCVMFMDDREIGSLVGSYNSADKGTIDATFKMIEMPMHVVNGFIPNQLFGLRGKGDGTLTVKGSLDRPDVNGEVFLDSCHLYSVPYGIDMRFSNDPVRIVGSRLMLENFEMYANNDNPLTIAGNIDFSNMDNLSMDVQMKAENYLIIDAKENVKSEAYGKAFINLYATMKGQLSRLRMKGELSVLPATDVAYVLRDSPLSTDDHNRLEGLVEFVNMSDTTKTYAVSRPALTGFNMDLTLNVSSGARIMCYLNAMHSNYVDLTGSGSLRMKYNPNDNLTLTGRYSLAGGNMKYSLPIIPLKTFTIKEGSYVEFSGDIMNPKLNIAATETIKAQVGGETGISRSVKFECGVKITKTLKDLGLEFTLTAPEDLEVATSLASMGQDTRGKLAVSMLTTGMYLADGNTSAFSMNTALNQFLQGEINNLTGSALRSIDFSFGLDNNTDQSGSTHTDYQFNFAKRFLNNRLKVAVGSVVSTGGYIEKGRTNSVFDHMDLEYRLTADGNTYVNFYYNNNSYDWLDGMTQEFGGGFVWRRSAETFKDLFRFKDKKEAVKPKETKKMSDKRMGIFLED